jgi:hypothetical protein
MCAASAPIGSDNTRRSCDPHRHQAYRYRRTLVFGVAIAVASCSPVETHNHTDRATGQAFAMPPCILPLPAVTKPQRLSVDGSAQPSGAIEPVQAWCPVHRFHQEPVATQERFLLWSERHGDALRQRAANEIDWDNVAEEIEDMGNNVVRSVASHLVQAILHDVPTARLAVLRLLRAPSTCRLTKSKTPPLGAVVLGPGASSGAAWTRLCNGTPAFCLRVPA